MHGEALDSFDAEVRQTLEGILGTQLSPAQWGQASRGFRHAGLGLRSAARHAPAAYLASAFATREFCHSIDGEFSWNPEDPPASLAEALRLFNAHLSPSEQLNLPSTPRGPSQKDLSRRIDNAAHTAYVRALSLADQQAILSECRIGASGFLTAIPSEALGLTMSREEFLVEIRARLLCQEAPQDDFCPTCDGVLDVKCHHARMCTGGADRTLRHHAVRNCAGCIFHAAGLNPVLERPGLLPASPDDAAPTSRRRPADVYLPTWTNGAPAALDFAVTSPQRQEAMASVGAGGPGGLELYEAFKRDHLDTASCCARQGLTFVPMVVEPTGAWGSTALSTLSALAKRSAAYSGDHPGAVMKRYGIADT